MNLNCPPEHDLADYDLAVYLHRQNVVNDPDENQHEAAGLPAVFCNQLDDEPDHAVLIRGPWEMNPVSASNPVLRFLVVARAADRSTLFDTLAGVYHSLHGRERFNLTDNQGALYCERVGFDSVAQDQNDRFVRVDTYELRMATPGVTFNS